MAAGAADSNLYYRPATGETWTEILDKGDFLSDGPGPSIGKGWRIIAGGK